MEVRLLAYFMDISEVCDGSLAAELRAGLDPHKQTATLVFETELDKVTSVQRQAAKQCLFSIIYGGGANTLIEQGIVGTKYEGYALLRRFYEARPGIKSIDLLARETFSSRGFVRSYWGRELRPLSPHKALNYIIQGSGSDILKDAMINIHTFLEDNAFTSHMVLNIHDELASDCVEVEVNTLARYLPDLMGNGEIGKIVPLEIDLAWGKSWATKEPYYS